MIINIYIFLIILFILFPKNIFGFLSESDGFDLYKKIDSGIYDLELKYLDKELKGGNVGGSIMQELNKIAKNYDLEECFSKELSTEDVIKINYGNNEILVNSLKNCFDNNNISNEAINTYLGILRESYSENFKKSTDKVDNIYKIGKIGLYSDGIEENSPFDLMIDLKRINEIIFEQEIPYNGVNTIDLGKQVNSILNGISVKQSFENAKYNKYIDNSNNNNNNNNNLINSNNKEIIDSNNMICTFNNSGLNDELVKNLINNTKNDITGNGNNTKNNIIENKITNKNNEEKNSDYAGNYSKVNDNKVWPCNNFFCITIEFIMYEHKLLGGGTNLSIEGLIKRANDHFKKFVNTSLIQSKMTTNHYELGLRDLNLPDIFHVGIQVSYKPVPILNLDKQDKNKGRDETDFSSKNLLSRYYRNLGLDYKRANDLDIFTQKEAELKSIIDSAELYNTEVEKKSLEFKDYIENQKKQNAYLSQTLIDKKIIQEDMQDFYEQFRELEVFTKAILDYTFGINGIIKKMREIPRGGEEY